MDTTANLAATIPDEPPARTGLIWFDSAGFNRLVSNSQMGSFGKKAFATTTPLTLKSGGAGFSKNVYPGFNPAFITGSPILADDISHSKN